MIFGTAGATHPALYKKTFESPHTRLHKREKLVGIPRNYASIKSNIDPALTLRSLDLLVQPRDGCGGWDGIQGHINDRCNPSRRGGLGASLEALPFCPPRLIEMYVRVDKPWE